MKDNYTEEDFKRGTLKNISDQISVEDKILFTIKAYLSSGLAFDKEKVRREVDAVLS